MEYLLNYVTARILTRLYYKADYARNAYAAFVEYYRINTPEYGPPLVTVDMTDPAEPFRLDESLSGSADAIPWGKRKGRRAAAAAAAAAEHAETK